MKRTSSQFEFKDKFLDKEKNEVGIKIILSINYETDRFSINTERFDNITNENYAKFIMYANLIEQAVDFALEELGLNGFKQEAPLKNDSVFHLEPERGQEFFNRFDDKSVSTT